MSVGQVGLLITIASALVTTLSASRQSGLELARAAAWLSALAMSCSLAALGLAFLNQTWELEYVADNSRSGVGPLLRLAGTWAGAEGSLLLWTTMVSWAAVLANRVARTVTNNTAAPNPATNNPAIAAQLGALTTGAYALINVGVASPFERLELAPIDGLGLQPILEHPAMVWHPPILYMGLVGLLPALFLGAGGHRVPAWLLRVPLAVLAVGLLSGSRWAHAELGWGGYWAWDPIETAGLVAWLCGAAALHVRDHASPFVLVCPGLAALWATTLTRIGVIESVHAFADRPALRLGLLFAVGMVSVASLLLALRLTRSHRRHAKQSWIHNHRALASTILGSAAFLAAAGTYQPLLEAATSGDRIAIAGTYFARLLAPLALVGVALSIRADKRWWPALAGAVGFLVLTPLSAGPIGLLLGAAGGSLVGTSAGLLGKARPGAVAHLGVGLMLVGIAGTVATESDTAWVSNNETVAVAGLELTHRSLIHTELAQQTTIEADMSLAGAEMRPGLVRHVLRGVSTSEVANNIRGLDEVQVILLDGDSSGARYRVNRLPRLALVWIGGLVLAAALVTPPLRRWLQD